jgi:hypothetical protein
MYGVGKDTYNPGNTLIHAADWVDLCHWVDEVRNDSTYLYLQSTPPLISESTKAEYRIMLAYTGSMKVVLKLVETWVALFRC